MQQNRIKLTVFFQSPYWVGICERHSSGMLEVCKITFGPEPSDSQLYEFLQQNWRCLSFSPPIAGDSIPPEPKNPKRARRQIARQIAAGEGVGTKSQQAVKLAQQQAGQARKQKNRQQRHDDQEKKFLLRCQKRKEKQKGH